MEHMEIIGDVLDLTHDIYLIYLELFRLEVNGCVQSNNYLFLVNTLKDKIDEEKELHEILAKNKNSFNILLNYIKNKSTQLLFLRMYGYMFFNEEINLLDGDDDCKFRNFYSNCNENLFLVYLSFLQDYIENDDYIYIREGLIYTKYYNIFMNIDLERELIDNNFELSEIKYLMSDILLINDKVSFDDVLEVYKDAIAVSVANLLIINDIDYQDNDRMVDVISSQCMLRASLSMLTDEQYENVKDGIYTVLNDLSNVDNNISVGIINSIIDDRVKDMIRTRKIFTRHSTF